MVKKSIVLGSLLLLGMIGFGVTYSTVVKENDALQHEDGTENYSYDYETEGGAAAEIEVERYDYSDSQENDALQYEDSTENYFYEYEDDDTAEIKVERIEYMD